jgi:4-amino-4-deoxy-L-arabinose transferase-like glycosyltransferase
MLEALQFRAGGRPDTAEAHATTWILLVATIWGACYLGSRVARPLVWVGVPAGLAVLLSAEALTAQADVPVAGFLGLGTLAMGLWLHEGRRSDLVLAAILLGGAASTKNEGLIGAVIVIAVALVVHAVDRRWRQVGTGALAGVAMLVVAVLPWRIWMGAHDITGTLPLSKGLNPSYLVDRFERVWPSVEAVASQITGNLAAQITVPIAIALALVRLRTLSRLAAFYLAVGVLYCAGLVWAYWISPLELQFHIFTSVGRVIIPAALIALAAILHLGGTNADRSTPPERATLDP